MHNLTFDHLRVANLSRCSRWHPKGVEDWSLADWGVAMAGEAGEVCDVIKKLNRCRDNIVGNRRNEEELMKDLALEIADTILYLDLLAARAGINIEDAVVEKFNAVSERLNFPERLPE